MHEHLQSLTEYIFPSHYVCWNERSDITALHAIGDGTTALSYYVIAIALIFLMRKYHFHVRLKFILWIYGTFIFLCGTTHIFDTVMIWYVTENVLLADGWIRVVTGLFSFFSAVVTVTYTLQFLKFTKEFFGITVRMERERRQSAKVSKATWDEFQLSLDSVRDFLYPMTDKQQR